MVQTAETIFRDFETDGVPASGKHQPKKSEIRPWGARLEGLYSAAQAGGGLAYETKADLTADLAHDASQIAWVMEDTTAANNGIYAKVGADGAGSWNRLGDLPYSYIKASNAGAGTANAIVATTSIPIPAADGGALIALPIVADNTGSPVTVSFNGGAALTVKTSSGNDVSVGGLTAGMIVAGYVSGATFRLLTDQASAAVVADAEAAADRAEAAAADAVNVGSAQFASKAAAEASALTSAPDYIRTAGYASAGDGGGALYKKVAAEPSHEGKFSITLADALTVVWYEMAETIVNVLQFGADPTGVADATTAFSQAAQVAISNLVRISLYVDLPLPDTANVIVPAGDWLLADWVDTGGVNITWLVDEAAAFVDDCSEFLTGRISRPSRTDFAGPYGSLDNACGYAVIIGMRDYSVFTPVGDRPAGVSGWLNPKQIGQGQVGPGGVVGLYSEASGIPPIATTANATYVNSTDVVLPIADVEVRRLRKGIYLETQHAITLRSFLMSWSDDGVNVTLVTSGWREEGATEADPDATPADDGSVLVIGSSPKSWATNFNVILNAGTEYPSQGVAGEVGIINYRTSPGTFDTDEAYSWGWDVVNLGQFKATNHYQARGSGINGYLASGMDVGFRCADFLSFTLPATGFRYDGSGIAFAKTDDAGNTQFQVGNGIVEIGSQGASGIAAIDFHTGAASVDYDSRILASGGSGASGGGALDITAVTVATPVVRPRVNNTYSLGTSSFFWTQVYATTGTINTSDPALKKFLDDDMTPLFRAVRRLKIQPFQWLDALEKKGDEARIHIGVNAQSVADAFEAEGLDARRYGLFCEDDEVEYVEVHETVEVPEMIDVEEECQERKLIDGKLVVSKRTRTIQKPKTIEVPVVKEDGTPMMQERPAFDENGNIKRDRKGRVVKELVPAVAPVQVYTTKTISRTEARPTGRKRLGLRYDQLTLLLLAAHMADN